MARQRNRNVARTLVQPSQTQSQPTKAIEHRASAETIWGNHDIQFGKWIAELWGEFSILRGAEIIAFDIRELLPHMSLRSELLVIGVQGGIT
jgi:hypothetical protein